MKTHYNYIATVHDSFQDIFDYVAEKLMEQGEKAFNFESETCQYRQEHTTGTVLKCAVGWLIPDDDYDPSFEDDVLVSVLRTLGLRYETTKDGNMDERFKFLQNLQRCHDDCPNKNFRVELWNNMTNLASTYKLDTTHLNKVYWSGGMSEPSP